MPVAYYMDHNVDDRITDGLRLRHMDVIMAREEGRDRTPDPSLLDRAGELGRVFFTHDRDFLREAARRQREGIAFHGVVFAPMLTYIGTCIENLERISERNNPEDMTNRLIHVPLYDSL